MNSITSFIATNSKSLASRVRQAMPPLHDPAVDSLHPGLDSLLRRYKGPQGHLVTGAVKALARQKDVVWGCAPGTGKTYQSIATTHCRAAGKPYAALVVCPPHLVGKWQREIEATVPDALVIQVESWRQWWLLKDAPRSLVRKPTWFITPISIAKLGMGWKAAANKNPCSGLLSCPQCYRPIKLANGNNVDRAYLEKDQRKCRECGSALWQNCGNEKMAPCKIIKKWMRGWFDMAILDEAHGMRAADTLAGESMHDFIGAARKVQLLTGTLIAGRADDLKPTFFRLVPSRFIDQGIKWHDGGEFAKRYGKIETVHTTRDGGKAKKTKSIRPGIMPGLYGDFVADRTLFLSLAEMGEALPSYTDTPVASEMPSVLSAAYDEMTAVLIGKFVELVQGDSPILGLRFLSTVAEALLTYPDDPSGWPMIGYWDEEKHFNPVYQPKDIDCRLPKEEALLRSIDSNRAEGRQTWVFSTRHATTERLLKLFKGRYDIGHLTTKISPVNREAWIQREGPQVEIMISHPEIVETGLDLYGEGYNFPALEWYNTGYRLNSLRQASARAWRIGQILPCTTRYHYYTNTAQAKVINLMARKLQAATYLEGLLDGGGLMAEESDDGIELAIVKQLAESVKSKGVAA